VGSVYNTTVSSARDALINKAEARPFFKNILNKPNPSTYAAEQGTTISGISSPALGASFVLLALNVPDQSSITLPSGVIVGASQPSSNNLKRNQILGGTLGTVAGLIIVGLIYLFLRRRRRPHRNEAQFEEPMQSPPLVEISPLNAATVASISTGSSKAQIMMMYDEVRPDAVSPSSDSGSRGAGTSPTSDSGHQQPTRLVPQRAANLHVTNLAPNEDKPLPSPMTPRLQPARRQPEDQNLRREIEQLRMEMDEMRAGQQLQQQSRIGEEPPPGYAEA